MALRSERLFVSLLYQQASTRLKWTLTEYHYYSDDGSPWYIKS